MDKTDFKKELKHLYAPNSKGFVLVEVPVMQFIMVDAIGAPSTSRAYLDALAWLYGAAYPIKFSSKGDLGRDDIVPPLEGQWWADDMTAFTKGDRDVWRWTMMIMQPEWVTQDMFEAGLAKASEKLGVPPQTLRFESFNEGLSVQVLHVGSSADEAPTIARLHSEYLPEHGLVENGHHHEIYLSDPRKVTPGKLKTILRQPVRRI
jgi:hypothetical protein